METYRCPKCGIEKTADNTWRDKGKRSGLASWCKSCSKVLRGTKYKEYYDSYQRSEASKEIIRKRAKKQYLDFKAFLYEKKASGCITCGYKKCLAALDFHHVDGDNEGHISQMNSKSAVEEELKNKNIVILCSNCHRELHDGLREP